MINNIERQNNIKKLIESMRIYNHVIAKESIAQSVASLQINDKKSSLIAWESQKNSLKSATLFFED